MPSYGRDRIVPSLVLVRHTLAQPRVTKGGRLQGQCHADWHATSISGVVAAIALGWAENSVPQADDPRPELWVRSLRYNPLANVARPVQHQTASVDRSHSTLTTVRIHQQDIATSRARLSYKGCAIHPSSLDGQGHFHFPNRSQPSFTSADISATRIAASAPTRLIDSQLPSNIPIARQAPSSSDKTSRDTRSNAASSPT